MDEKGYKIGVKFRTKYKAMMLFLLIILNVIVRFPCTPHELQTDSFYIHGLALSISMYGHAQWILHPLSFFGLYPFSYPSGVPFFTSGASQCSGLNMELTILIISAIFGILSIFTSYLMAKTIWDDDRFKLFVAFGYSLSPLLLKLTVWTVMARGLFIVLLPLFLWSLFKGHDSKGISKGKYFLLLTILLIVLAAIHRMFWFALIVCITYPLIIIAYNISNKIRIYEKYKTIKVPFFFISFMFILAIFLLVLGMIQLPTFFSNNVLLSLLVSNKIIVLVTLLLLGFIITHQCCMDVNKRIRAFLASNLMVLVLTMFLIQFTPLAPWRDIHHIHGSNFAFLLPSTSSTSQSLLLNSSIEIGARLGIFILLSVIGIFYITWKGKLDLKRVLLIMILLTFLPFTHIEEYFHEILVFTYIFAGFVLVAILSLNLNKYKIKFKDRLKGAGIPAIILTLVLLSSLVFSGYTLIHRYNNIGAHGERNYMTDATENAGLFVKSYAHDIKIVGVEVWQIHTISEQIPVVNKNKVKITPGSPPDSITDFDGWFSYFKQPVKGIITAEEEKELLWFGFAHPPYWQYYINYEIHDRVYHNGENSIWYLKEHKWRYLSLE